MGKDKTFELYGYGFNAHGQLNPDLSSPREDLPLFKCFKTSDGFLHILRASWSQVVGTS